jgi:hypothetical protein
MDRERRRSMVDHGHRPGEGSPENGRNGVLVRRTSPRLRKNGEGTELSLTGCKRGGGGSDTTGRWWGTIGRGGAWWSGRCGLGSKQAIEGEVSVVMAGGAPRPFIVAGEGHTGAGEGETAGGNSLNTIDGRAT